MLTKLAALSAEEKARGIVTWSGRKRRAGRRLRARDGGHPVLGLHVGDGEPAEDRGDARLRRRGGPRCHDHPRGPRATARLRRGVGPDASSTRSTTRSSRRATERWGWRSSRIFPSVATIVVPVGGGGLIAGVASAVDCRVVGVEPERAPSLTAALEAGAPVHIEPSSIADGLNAPFTGAGTLEVCRERVDEVVLVSEEEIAEAMRFLYTRAKLACEPAGAAAVAALLAGRIELEAGSPLVAVVSGGNADPKVVAGILASR